MSKVKTKDKISAEDQEMIRKLKNEKDELQKKHDELKKEEERLQDEISDLTSGNQEMTINGFLLGAILMANVLSFIS